MSSLCRGPPAESRGRTFIGAHGSSTRGSIPLSCSRRFPVFGSRHGTQTHCQKWRRCMARKDVSNKNFESAMEEIEQVVEQIESGELSLEESLAAYEKGVGLVKFCYQKLNEVEKRIEFLIKDKEGKLQLKVLENLPAEDKDRDGRSRTQPYAT